MQAQAPPGLVGRTRILGQLSDALSRAASGTPTVVVVSGETGVGKTRLVAEFLAGAEVTTFAGACVPVAGEPLPYAALTQALRRNAGLGAVRQETQRSPELARLLPGAASAAAADAAVEDEARTGASSRLRLYQAVLALLGRLGAGQPVVHVVEDVHWADRSTLDLLAFLATNLTDERVLVLLTCRDDAVDESRTLDTWLAELGRMRTVRIELPRLDQGEVARLVAGLGVELTPEQLDETYHRSAGNPLFVEQLLLAGDEPGPLPASLRELLRSRVDRLPEAALAVLRAAAVIGRPATVSLVAHTVGDAEPEVESRLRPALTAKVAEVRDDRVSFQHPAFGEVVYAELLPGERARMHRAAAEALAREPDPAPVVAGEIARHWHAAGDLERALTASIHAGASYERMYAFSEAFASFGRALEILDRVPSDVDRVDLASRAAESASLIGESAAAVRLLEQAIGFADDERTRAALLEQLGAVHLIAGDAEGSSSAYRAAMELLPDDEQSPLVARVYAGFALLAAGWSWLDEAELAGFRALEVSRRVGARREEGTSLNALGIVTATRGDPDRGIAQLRDALDLAREVQSPYSVGAAYVNLSHVLAFAGRLDDCAELCREGIVELGRYGQDRQFGSILVTNGSDALIKAGRLAEAEPLIAAAMARHPRGLMAAPVLLAAARLAVAQGNLTLAWERCEQARTVIEAEGAPLGWLREITETASDVELWAGRPVAALELVTDCLSEIAGTDEAMFGTGLVARGLRALADEAITHRDPQSREQRAPVRDRLLAELATVRGIPGWDELPEADALARLCAAEQARLDEGAAPPALWADAADAWAAIERPLPAAYARWREAESLLAGGIDAESIAALRRVHDTAGALGAARLVAEVENLATWYRIDLLPPVEERDDQGADALAAYALTTREVEVLAALAEGRTNKEIAEALFISVKTASVHVSNLLRKLDVPGRREAARLAHRLGVTDSDAAAGL
ncbi:helix-turn-helix transcriptional regulator [Nocardioides sp.]|uniref:helix-turn-helix transcriptional regulator n=1 Tax=Nocardioides sp. TaxID=35761 RepID=UPI002ED06747